MAFIGKTRDVQIILLCRYIDVCGVSGRVINGSKIWITNAGVSNWLFVLAVTDKGASAGRRMTGFIVDSDAPGVSFGEKLVNMGQRCSGTRENGGREGGCLTSNQRLFNSKVRL